MRSCETDVYSISGKKNPTYLEISDVIAFDIGSYGSLVKMAGTCEYSVVNSLEEH